MEKHLRWETSDDKQENVFVPLPERDRLQLSPSSIMEKIKRIYF